MDEQVREPSLTYEILHKTVADDLNKFFGKR